MIIETGILKHFSFDLLLDLIFFFRNLHNLMWLDVSKNDFSALTHSHSLIKTMTRRIAKGILLVVKYVYKAQKEKKER